jgi:pimeloyl-ACP methyl ester carboxylesterase
MADQSKSPFVLVHGAWHGGWCWNKLIPHLESAGHRALAVTLTGQGDRAHLINPSVDLSTHVTDVVSVLEMDDLSDVILVGHSYGGLVVCGAAERASKRIRRLVYLDALVPRHGQSGFDLNSHQFREKVEQDARDNGDGYKVAPIVDILGITDVVDLEWVRARVPCQSVRSVNRWKLRHSRGKSQALTSDARALALKRLLIAAVRPAGL